MDDRDIETHAVKDCCRCGGRAFFWQTAIVPGDPLAPRGSHRGTAHYQPAWTCINCGFIEPLERRTRLSSADEAGRPGRVDTALPRVGTRDAG